MKEPSEYGGSMTVGRTARLADVWIPTMRFYERAGLLQEPRRAVSNYRLYPAETVARICFIRRAQQYAAAGQTAGRAKSSRRSEARPQIVLLCRQPRPEGRAQAVPSHRLLNPSRSSQSSASASSGLICFCLIWPRR